MDDLRHAPPRGVVQIAFGLEMALACVALVVGWVFGVPPLESLAWSWRDLALGLLATLPMVGLLLLAIRLPLAPLERISQLVNEFVRVLFERASVWDVAAVSAAAGFGEELLFRGLFQVGAERLTGSPWLAVAAGAVLFGAAHPITRTYAVLAAGIGLYFGWLFVATGNLLVPMVAHAAYDFAAILYFIRASHEKECQEQTQGTVSETLSHDDHVA